ncbi:MAG: AI-2E family transporter [Hyphomicrobiaceae bacterium]
MRAERQLLFWGLAALALLFGIAMLREVLLPFVVGAVVAYFLNPVADRLVAMGLGRGASAALLVALGAVTFIATLVLVAPLLANQVRQISETLPDDVARLRAAIESWASSRLGTRYPQFQGNLERALSDLAQSWSGSVGTVVRSLWSQSLALVNLVSLFLITPVVVFYFLLDWHRMIERVDSWLPREHAPTIRRLAIAINDAVSAFIRGQGTICLILGTLYGVGLVLIGLKYGLVLGLLTGLLSFVPFVGWALGLIVASVLALIQSWPDATLLLKVLGVFAAGMALDSALLSPLIVGKKIGLHPVWLMFSLIVFSYLFGIVGMLVAVPVAAAIGVLVRYGLEQYLASSVYLGKPGNGATARPTDVGGGAP